MINISDAAESILTGDQSWIMHTRVESHLDGQLLTADVPVAAGREDVDLASRIPERVTLSVPRVVDGVDWSPAGDVRHPLAAYGQRLRIMLGVELTSGVVEWLQRGEYVITRCTPAGDELRVEAAGLLWLVDEARLVSPYQPTGTIVSTLRGLVEPAVTVDFDAALADRSVPAGINYDEDRLQAVYDVLDAWPAQARVNADGYLYVEEVTTPTVADFTISGTLAAPAGDVGRDGAANCVVARGTQSDGALIQGVAYDETTGPHRFGGPFNPLPVPSYFTSPLLTTVAQAQAAARTRLAKLTRQQGRSLTVRSVPLPHVEAGDVAEHDGELYTVEALSMPLTAGDGEMTATIALVTG